jgi:hypothetical protein
VGRAAAGRLGGRLDHVGGGVEVRFADLQPDRVAVGGRRAVEHHTNL